MISASGAQCIATSPANTHGRQLDLSDNTIYKEGACAIASALKTNASLEKLKLRATPPQMPAWSSMSALRTNRMQALYLGSNWCTGLALRHSQTHFKQTNFRQSSSSLDEDTPTLETRAPLILHCGQATKRTSTNAAHVLGRLLPGDDLEENKGMLNDIQCGEFFHLPLMALCCTALTFSPNSHPQPTNAPLSPIHT